MARAMPSSCQFPQPSPMAANHIRQRRLRINRSCWSCFILYAPAELAHAARFISAVCSFSAAIRPDDRTWRHNRGSRLAGRALEWCAANFLDKMTHRIFDLFAIATNPWQIGRRTSSCPDHGWFWTVPVLARIDQVRTQQTSPSVLSLRPLSTSVDWRLE
jgi:hypothetical protein